MRISNSMIYDLASNSMTDLQSSVYKTQAQMSSGLSMLSSADDPAAAAQALQISQGLAVTQQQQANMQSAGNTLAQADTALGSTGTLLQSATDLLLSAQNSTMSASDLGNIATQLQSMQQQLVSLANSSDGAGHYLFGGYANTSPPFIQGPGGVAYNGDGGVPSVEVASGTKIAVSAGGAATFMNIKTGNGTFTTAAGAANTGGGMIDSGSVSNPAPMTGDAYQLKFNVAGGVPTYDVLDTTSGATVSTGNAFTSGSAITVGGMQFTISGQPASGDTFSVGPSANQSVFQSLANGIAALQSNGNASVRESQINGVIADLYQAQDHITSAQAGLGATQNEVTTLTSMSNTDSTNQQVYLGNLTDLNYAAATTQLSQQQTVLQAAQQTFGKVSQLSLFSYIA
jgi:flagellar hook-associated protein 3 FlgL